MGFPLKPPHLGVLLVRQRTRKSLNGWGMVSNSGDTIRVGGFLGAIGSPQDRIKSSGQRGNRCLGMKRLQCDKILEHNFTVWNLWQL
jgi:hypothetical protein